MNYDDILKFIALFYLYINTGLFVGFILINDNRYSLALKFQSKFWVFRSFLPNLS